MKPAIVNNELVRCDGPESESDYLASLDNHLCTLVARPSATLESVVRGARGAFPTVVAERLQFLGLDRSFPEESEINVAVEPSFTGPELHPLDFEWYFAPKSADDLARIITSDVPEVLCLGAPTVAAAIARRGRRATLVDHNPLVSDRFRREPGLLQFIVFDLFNPLPLTTAFPAVFFDAPWYPEFVSVWLWQAARLVHPGGLIAFALFPPLLRPGAEHERSNILEIASTLGPVEIMEEALLYETPLFEWEVLARDGIHAIRDWRCADLVLIRAETIPRVYRPIVCNPQEKWDSFLLGRQVVKLRRQTRGERDIILGSLREFPDFLFPSVSMRDPRRGHIDLWTSRNRVAQVGQRNIVSDILDHLSGDFDFDNLLKLADISHYGEDDQELLISNLQRILTFSGERTDAKDNNS